MIVVVGSVSGRQDGDAVRAGGLAASIAIVAASGGQTVQMVARVGDDPTADAVLRDLTVHGVGHVAVLRDAAHPTPIEAADRDSDGVGSAVGSGLEPEDVELALRYLTDFTVVTIVGRAGPVLPVVERAAAWAAATLVIVDGGEAETGDAGIGDTQPTGPATRLTRTDGETRQAFATRIGDHIARLDAARDPVRSAR